MEDNKKDIKFVEPKDQVYFVNPKFDQMLDKYSNSLRSEELERDMEDVREKVQDEDFREILKKMHRLGIMHDISKYGMQIIDTYVRGWDGTPVLLHSPLSQRETTFLSNLDYMFDGEKYKELARGTSGEGTGYRPPADTPESSQSTTVTPTSSDVAKSKEQFDFAGTAPRTVRVKYRNIIGEDGTILDVTGVGEAELRKLMAKTKDE